MITIWLALQLIRVMWTVYFNHNNNTNNFFFFFSSSRYYSNFNYLYYLVNKHLLIINKYTFKNVHSTYKIFIKNLTQCIPNN